MGAGETPKEFISGPGSLEEYLVIKAGLLKDEIASYRMAQERTLTQKAEMGSIIRAKQAEHDGVNRAHQVLAEGNKEPGLEILRKEIGELIERIAWNKENEYEVAARENNAILVVLQMLLADETGIQPDHFGFSESRQRETYYMPENVGKSDLVNTALFRTMMALGSYNPPTSGYYPTPDSVSAEYTINRLFNYDCGLSDEEKALIVKQLNLISGSIKAFATAKFKYRYEESLPAFPGSDMKPHELIRYHSYNEVSESPNAVFYMEGSQIKCRYSRDKRMAGRVYDLTQSDEGIELETVKDVDELPQELQDKIFGLLRSDELKAHWEQVAPRTKIPQMAF